MLSAVMPIIGCREDSEPCTAEITVAESPFDDVGADIILRSSNNVHFYVYKAILSMVSPVFKDMFSGDSLSAEDLVDHRPCILVQDEAVELYQLLSWCDPRCRQSTSLDPLQLALRLADKYLMEDIICRIGSLLESLDDVIKADCFKVYSIAIQYQFSNLIRKAAQYSLAIPIHDFPQTPEFRNVSGSDVQNLYAFHLACSNATRSFIQTGAWIRDEYIHAFSVTIPRCCPPEGRPIQFGTKHLELKKWFATYIQSIRRLVTERPVASTVLDLNNYQDALIAMEACAICRYHLQTFLSLVSLIAEGVYEATESIEVGQYA